MFGFFKTSEERKLIRLGYSDVLSDYQKQLKNKIITRKAYKSLIQNLLVNQKDKLVNIDNVNVSTRQSFVDDDTLVSLNVSRIQVPQYDLDFIKNKISFDYKNHKRLYRSEIDFLFQFFKTEFSESIDPIVDLNATQDKLVDIITSDYSEEKASLIHQAFLELLKAI